MTSDPQFALDSKLWRRQNAVPDAASAGTAERNDAHATTTSRVLA